MLEALRLLVITGGNDLQFAPLLDFPPSARPDERRETCTKIRDESVFLSFFRSPIPDCWLRQPRRSTVVMSDEAGPAVLDDELDDQFKRASTFARTGLKVG